MSLHQGTILIRCGVNLQLFVFVNDKPCPSRSEMRFRGFDEHFATGIEGTESGLNGFGDLAHRFAAAGGHNIPEKRMVRMPTAAVDNGLSEMLRHLFDISEHALKGHVL